MLDVPGHFSVELNASAPAYRGSLGKFKSLSMPCLRAILFSVFVYQSLTQSCVVQKIIIYYISYYGLIFWYASLKQSYYRLRLCLYHIVKGITVSEMSKTTSGQSCWTCCRTSNTRGRYLRMLTFLKHSIILSGMGRRRKIA